MKVSEIMTRDPIVIEVPNRRSVLLKVLAKGRKTGVPVVKKGTVDYVGMVTRYDIIAKPDINQVALLTTTDCGKVSSSDDASKALKSILASGRRHVPVVDRGKIKGIITPTNFLKVIIKKGVKTSIIDLVQRPCIPVWDQTPISVASEMMRVTGVSALVVVDTETKIIGLVTDRDIQDLSMVERFTAEDVSGSGEDSDPWSWEGIRDFRRSHRAESRVHLPPVPVDQVMAKKPVTVFERSPACKAAELMLRNDYGQLPIRDNDDRIRGMCYDMDLIRCLL